jgi:uncharacterized metal-binding protein YceD (DUF177 family)
MPKDRTPKDRQGRHAQERTQAHGQGKEPLSRRRAAAAGKDAPRARADHAPAHAAVHEAPPPFSRLVEVRSMPAPGLEVSVEANAAEREALALFLGEPAVARLEGVYQLKPGSAGRVAVSGLARATLTRNCVLTLEPFETTLEEPVEVVFASEPERSAAHRSLTAGRGGREEEVDLAALSSVDPPEPIVDGKIDLGALTTEFVALGLDPYPRKPGAAFTSSDAEIEEKNPFSALADLAPPQEAGEG